ncbi:MAG: hypothetical protein BWY69_01586 [Planctomycetes bacterium ADurb.Bin401]|nr:MAG: hypothetical protein BWY69_01586 [Planctomycetes bacterium ADurb.Bin401]
MSASVTVITCSYSKRERQLDEAFTHQIQEKLQVQSREKINQKEHIYIDFTKISDIVATVATI